ncbi:hypothetical protein ACFX15_045208 [Malus domestica]
MGLRRSVRLNVTISGAAPPPRVSTTGITSSHPWRGPWCIHHSPSRAIQACTFPSPSRAIHACMRLSSSLAFACIMR